MSDKQNYIELPLDPEYVTIEGAYMAGYIWGQHVRSEKDARQMFPGDTPLHEDFYKGVADGYNDKMNEMNARIAAPTKETSAEATADAMAQLGKQYATGTISIDQYKTYVDQLYSNHYKQQDDNDYYNQAVHDLMNAMAPRPDSKDSKPALSPFDLYADNPWKP